MTQGWEGNGGTGGDGQRTKLRNYETKKQFREEEEGEERGTRKRSDRHDEKQKAGSLQEACRKPHRALKDEPINLGKSLRQKRPPISPLPPPPLPKPSLTHSNTSPPPSPPPRTSKPPP